MLYVQRVERDAEMQEYLETEVAQFLAEVEADVNELQKKGTM